MDQINLNGYSVPAVYLPNQPSREPGRYGRMRKKFLEQNRPLTYNTMLLDGTLLAHLLEVEDEMWRQVQQTIQALLILSPVPDKQSNPLGWAQHMNNLKMQAEEQAMSLITA